MFSEWCTIYHSHQQCIVFYIFTNNYCQCFYFHCSNNCVLTLYPMILLYTLISSRHFGDRLLGSFYTLSWFNSALVAAFSHFALQVPSLPDLVIWSDVGISLGSSFLLCTCSFIISFSFMALIAALC